MSRYSTVLALVGVLFAIGYLPVAAMAEVKGPSKEITVVFRYDDPSGRSSTDEIARVIAAFRKHGMCCTFGVIPLVCAGDVHDPKPQASVPLPPTTTELLSDAAREGVLEIGLHGLSHQVNGLYVEGRLSEFTGLTYQEQVRRIAQGKELLETGLDVSVGIFIPPWNTYDVNTLRALDATGLQFLMADRRGVAEVSCSLQFLPATISVGQLREAVIAAENAPDPAPLVMVLFHAYDFREIDEVRGTITFDEFDRTLQWLSGQKNVRVLRASDTTHATSRRYSENQRLLRMRGLLPKRLPVKTFPLVHLSEEGFRNVKRRLLLWLAVFYGGEALIVGVLVFLVALVLSAKGRVFLVRCLLLLGPTLLLGGFFWTVHDNDFGAKAVIGITGAVGYCGGIWSLVWWRRSQRPESLGCQN